ncbi:hypothetical protein SSP531S_15170 [Streptomyces spongiicola]|uniref:Uncharacterized protein n=1 Tax=Streptomyces spongiicola TaxID=1690221 RepID=A0A388SU15_9ACTN|nr:hypothetical protein SSP531S_15170 [Streptomyces spongiicola]
MREGPRAALSEPSQCFHHYFQYFYYVQYIQYIQYIQYEGDPPPCDRTHRAPRAPLWGRTELPPQHALPGCPVRGPDPAADRSALLARSRPRARSAPAPGSSTSTRLQHQHPAPAPASGSGSGPGQAVARVRP